MKCRERTFAARANEANSPGQKPGRLNACPTLACQWLTRCGGAGGSACVLDAERLLLPAAKRRVFVLERRMQPRERAAWQERGAS